MSGQFGVVSVSGVSVGSAGHVLPLQPCDLHVQICDSPGEMLGDQGVGSLKKMENL